MKCAIFFIAFIVISLASAQSNQNVVNNTGQALAKSGNAVSAYGAPAAMFYNPDTKTKGSVHLFENWDNSGVIYTAVSHKYSLKNINLNIEKNTFEAKISNDSVFTFNFDNIDRFVINGRIFKNYNFNKQNKVFEVINNSGKLTLLKGYNVQLIKGSTNPMLNRTNNKFVRSVKYFLLKDDKISLLPLKKSRFLKLFNFDESHKKKVQHYIKQYHLSLKNEDHLKRIMVFIDNNK